MNDRATTIRNDAAGDRRLGRRAMLGGAAGAAAAGLASRMGAPAAAQDASPAATEGGRATFVLVHGSNAGAWVWRKVIPLLREAGHDVYATTATGMGDRVHLADPAIDLDVFITDVVNVLAYEDLHDVILVGHSSAGFVVSGVAERVPERLAQLVYLDAIVPEDGQNLHEFWGFTDEVIGFEYRAGAEAGYPGFEVVHPGFEEFLRAMITDSGDADWVLSKMTPHPIATSIQPIHLGNPAAAELSRAFIYCSEEKGPPEEDPLARVAERVRSDPAWTFREVAANHLVLVNDPQVTAETLLSLV